MDLALTNKAVLVAGSSRGIGKAIAQAFVAEHARVCITGRDASSLSATQKELGDVIAFAGDLSDPGQAQAAVTKAVQEFGALDVLVCNLGTGAGQPGWDQHEDEWERLFRVNFQASTRLAQAAIPELIKTGGNIVFVASITGMEATPAPLPYSAAKAALINYSKNLARQLARSTSGNGVRVNAVAPGNILFAGGSWERHLRNNRDGVSTMIDAEVPMNRFGTPQEIADVVIFLASARASFLTGECIVADGGQSRSI